MYFKYSSNNFKENGTPYSGMFRVDDGKIFKGYTDTQELSSDNTYFKNFSLNLKNYSNTYENIDQIHDYTHNPFQLINKQHFTELFYKLNDNNLTIFKSLVAVNSKIFNRSNVRYYTLSSQNSDFQLSDEAIHSETVNTDDTWAFLNSITSGVMLPTSIDTFKYLCSTGTELISLSGSFTNSSITITTRITLELGLEIQNIYYSENDERLNIIQNDELLIYDGLLYKNCDNFILLDSVKLLDVDVEMIKWSSKIKFSETFAKFSQKYTLGNPNNPEFIRFGNNYRTSIDNNILFILNKYSSDEIFTLRLSDYGIDDCVAMDIREIDDKIAILHEKYQNNVGVYISYITTNPTKVTTQQIQKFNTNNSNCNLRFLNFDSDFILFYNQRQYQLRSIEKSTHPLGELDQHTLKYLPKFTWSKTQRLFGNPKFKWDTNNQPSNNLNIKISNAVFVGDTLYCVIVSDSRFYVITQKIEDFYRLRVDENLIQQHIPPTCYKSSVGQYLNDNIFSIVDDVAQIYNQAHCNYEYSHDKVDLNIIRKIKFDIDDIYLNLNEKFHVQNFRKIFNKIFNIQKQLISISSTSE